MQDYVRWLACVLLKGQSHEIFDPRFFSLNGTPGCPDSLDKVVFNIDSNSRRKSIRFDYENRLRAILTRWSKTQVGLIHEKTEARKSRETVPLRPLMFQDYWLHTTPLCTVSSCMDQPTSLPPLTTWQNLPRHTREDQLTQYYVKNWSLLFLKTSIKL
jgi:hypothetical protein